mgnify:FL=1
MHLAVGVHNVEPQDCVGFVFLVLVRGILDLVFEVVVGDRGTERAENGGEILCLLDINPVAVVGGVPVMNTGHGLVLPREAGWQRSLGQKASQIALVTGANDMHFRPVLIEVGRFFNDRIEADI